MTVPASNQPPERTPTIRSGKRHWFQITGLPGWKRAQLGIPAFGKANCFPPPAAQRNPTGASAKSEAQKDQP
jgi:hypothetical protein